MSHCLSLAQFVPSVKQVIVQSDNGACFASREFTVGLGTMEAITGVRVQRLMHTEAQDGKSHLDGSFGILSQALRRYVDENHDITTAQQLAAAVTAADAANTIVRLVTLDPDHMKVVSAVVAKSLPDFASVRAFKDISYAADRSILLSKFCGIGPEYLIEAADVQRWWEPTCSMLSCLTCGKSVAIVLCKSLAVPPAQKWTKSAWKHCASTGTSVAPSARRRCIRCTMISLHVLDRRAYSIV